ncbi:3-deoxy-D-manno-octulosonic acid transferase, partial [Caulobacter sp. S45]|uniref:3-deoxy-D-manno-octulosonic acid transferase n=1 Tax=Caulobacter sp. S45 TaxID=1641861 RepID=UPI002739F5A9
MSLALAAYRAATTLLEPLAPALLRARMRRGKEDPARLPERLGIASAPRPPGRLVWLHGASVGEGLSLLPLVQALAAADPALNLLVTSGTRTSAELLGRRLPPGAFHQFAPVDGPRATACFLQHWRPDLAVFAESELWPNLILGA